ncbi:MAG: polysaccharide deacetylase family protein [Magnetococcus sp. DMHC-1]
MLTILRYDYVRDMPDTAWTGGEGLSARHFEGQLDHIQRYYTICTPEQVLAATHAEGDPLPDNACLLTFDGGLRDHYVTVLPRLLARQVTGCFFPIVAAAENRWVLIVHKVQHLLAAPVDREKLFQDLLRGIDAWREAYELPSTQSLLAACASGVVGYNDFRLRQFKCLLQHVLPRQAAWAIAGELFRKHVTADEAGFAEELYLTTDELREMVGLGMGVGGHGVRHDSMEHLSRHGQREKMLRSREYLAQILGEPPSAWIMNYPYGSHDARTVELARAVPGCRLAVTNCPGVVENFSQPYQLPRLHSHNLPKTADAPPCAWTRMTLAASAREQAA